MSTINVNRNTRSSSIDSADGISEARLSAMARLNEVKKLAKERANYAVETAIDIFDFAVKTTVTILFFLDHAEDGDQSEFNYYPHGHRVSMPSR